MDGCDGRICSKLFLLFQEIYKEPMRVREYKHEQERVDGVYEVQKKMQHVCVRGRFHARDNDSFRKLLVVQKRIQESILQAGMWQIVAAQ